MDEQDRITLSQYRLSRAEEMLMIARRDAEAQNYASANNRAYYCIFHTMRAVLALDGEDFKRHSAVISRFSQNYLKTRVFSGDYGKIIRDAFLIRNRSDYEDFYICSIADTEKLISNAAAFYEDVRAYLEERYH